MVAPIRKALFPGVLAGIMAVVYITNAWGISRADAHSEAPAAAPMDAALAPFTAPTPAPDAAPAIETRAEENVSPADVLVGFFLPLIYGHEEVVPEAPAPAQPEPAPETEAQAEQAAQDSGGGDNDDDGGGGGCSVGGGFSDNILRWCEQITRNADGNGLDPNLVAAVMTIESGGDPNAYSSSGAVGLMQVMPRDGIAASFVCVNGPCFAKRPSMDELFDPEYNLQYATGMLAGLINRHGSWREALRAYGPAGAGYSYADKVLGVYERGR